MPSCFAAGVGLKRGGVEALRLELIQLPGDVNLQTWANGAHRGFQVQGGHDHEPNSIKQDLQTSSHEGPCVWLGATRNRITFRLPSLVLKHVVGQGSKTLHPIPAKHAGDMGIWGISMKFLENIQLFLEFPGFDLPGISEKNGP